MANYLHVIFFSAVGGVFSLIGGFLLLSKKKSAETLAKVATPFAAGALLAAAFFDLLPEAGELVAGGAAMRWALAGLLAFFLLEHFLHWFHHHHEHADKKMRAAAPLIITGDTIHNLIDGIAIGAAFLIDVPTGIVVALAVAAHEIPQEIGDFGVLLKSGMERRKVLTVNVISALMSTVGAVLTFWLGLQTSIPLGELLAVTAGMFIYIAASDLIPTIHENSSRQKLNHMAAALLLFGVLTVGITTEIAHEYIDAGHGHEHSHSEEKHDREEGAHSHSEQFVIEDHNVLPTLAVSLAKDSVSGYNLHLETTNFKFSADNVGGEAVVGEGHAHVYVNGEKIARLYAQAMHLPDLEAGDLVRVTLNANDHREISHDGLVLRAELEVGKQSSAVDALQLMLQGNNDEEHESMRKPDHDEHNTGHKHEHGEDDHTH